MMVIPGFAVLFFLATFFFATNSENAKCGRPSTFRVMAGSDARSGQWPWQISLQTYGIHYCGGSLIDSETVVTAAHCIVDDILDPERRWTVVVGANDLRTIRRGSKNIHKIRIVKKHEQFRGVHSSFDVAIIKLEIPVVFDEFTSPVCLPENEKDIVPVGTDCVVSGWGDVEPKGEKDVEVLQYAPLKVITNSACEIPYRYHHRKVVHEGNVCAGGGVPENACHGDSGGPLSCYRDNHWVLDGAVSWGGQPCGKHQEPSVFARISSYIEWINENRQM